MNDLWSDLDLNSQDNEESNAVTLLREQARLLGKKTGGKVKATFSKVEFANDPTALLNGIANVLSSVQLVNEELEAELQGKQDLNTIFGFTSYKFEIYTDKYRFRLFALKNRLIFPIEIYIDEGICEEFHYGRMIEIKSNAHLEEVVTNVFGSKKVKIILSKLMKE